MNLIKKVALTMLIIIGLTLSFNSMGQGAPDPPSGDHGQSGNQPGGNAPIAGGLFILLGLGAAYGGKKVYDLRKKQIED